MPTPVIMPKMEMSQETATLIEWLVEEGQQVEKGQPLFEVETDKVTVEVESPATGTIAGLDATPGAVVPVTTIIAYILGDGESLPQSGQSGTLPTTGDTAVSPPEVYPVTPVAQRLAADLGIDVGNLAGTGPGGRITKADVLEAKKRADAGASGEVSEQEKVRATPAARRIAREMNIALDSVPGSGPRGRVQVADVRLAMASSQSIPEETEVEAQPVVLPDSQTAGVLPLTGMRRTIAQRMTQSWQSTPHVTFTVEVDMTAALSLLADLNQRSAKLGMPKISVTALLVKTGAWALKRHPYANASLLGEQIHLHADANIGVAVALEQGLIVPVVKQAERLGLSEIAAQVSTLSQRARDGQLTPADVSGGTFTISNLGMYRIDHFTAIVNPPQSAILAVGRTSKRQVVIETDSGDEVVIRPIMHMTLSADHRVLDGAQAAMFLNDFVEALEQPGLMML